MRAFTLDDFESPPRLRDDLPKPEVASDAVVVRVHTSSVTPADAAIAAGMLKEMFEYEFPVTLGRDFAGVVEEAGMAVSLPIQRTYPLEQTATALDDLATRHTQGKISITII